MHRISMLLSLSKIIALWMEVDTMRYVRENWLVILLAIILAIVSLILVSGI